MTIAWSERAQRANRFFEASHDDGRVTLEGGAAALSGFVQERLERRDEPFGGKRRGPMLVNDAARRRLERGRERRSGLHDIVVHERLELRRLVPDQEGERHRKELRLPLTEVANELEEQFDIELLLPGRGCGRMLAGDREIAAVAGTPDLSQPLGATADGADLLVERGARPPRLSLAAQRTYHNGHGAILYNWRKKSQYFIGTRLAVTAVSAKPGLVYG